MPWKLFLDDVRDPDEPGYAIARSTAIAIQEILKKKELPNFISFDHDLGGDDDAMKFLKELYHLWEMMGSDPAIIPDYVVHSANPLGTKNIIAYMSSWKKSVILK